VTRRAGLSTEARDLSVLGIEPWSDELCFPEPNWRLDRSRGPTGQPACTDLASQLERRTMEVDQNRPQLLKRVIPRAITRPPANISRAVAPSLTDAQKTGPIAERTLFKTAA